ncbi:hypothetical protein BH10ACT11_BH10ACT11_10740 [soil metagenome]
MESKRSSARPEAVWKLWSNPRRWSDWNEQLESAELDGELGVGAKAEVKFRKGGKMVFEVLECEPGKRFLDEAKLIGCRFGHEHIAEPSGEGVQITHRLYLTGPLSGLFATMFGRKKLRESVGKFIDRERELAE